MSLLFAAAFRNSRRSASSSAGKNGKQCHWTLRPCAKIVMWDRGSGSVAGVALEGPDDNAVGRLATICRLADEK